MCRPRSCLKSWWYIITENLRLCRVHYNRATCTVECTTSSWADERFTGIRINDLSKLEVRLRKLISLISELTNRGVFLSTTWSSESSHDHSKGSAMQEHFVPPVLEDGYRQGQCQGLYSVYCPQQLLTDSAVCYRRPRDDRHATR